MPSQPIADLLQISLENLKQMIDANTIVGNEINIKENVTLIPISKVNCSFVSGGTEMSKGKIKEDDAFPFGGATGGKVVIDPIAVVAVTNDDVKVLHFNDKTYLAEAFMEKLPSLIENVKETLVKKKLPKVTNLEIVEKK